MLKKFFVVSLVLGFASTAYAQEMQPEDNRNFMQRLGADVTLSGGGTGFTNETLRNTTTPGGAWGLRIGMGTASYVGGEIAYSGGAQELNTLGVDDDALLVSNGIGGSIRVNMTAKSMIQPYIMAGLAWRRYDVISEVNTSSVNEVDNVLETPASLGVALRAGGFLFDARATFSPTVENDLIGDEPLHNWSATAGIGYGF